MFGGDGADGFEYGLVGIHRLGEILGLVADFNAVPQGAFAVRQLELVGENPEQGCLAQTVESDESGAVPRSMVDQRPRRATSACSRRMPR